MLAPETCRTLLADTRSVANVVHASPLLPVREVADRFAVSEKTVRRLIERGELPALRERTRRRLRPVPLPPTGRPRGRRRAHRREDRKRHGALLVPCTRCAGRASSVTPCALPSAPRRPEKKGTAKFTGRPLPQSDAQQPCANSIDRHVSVPVPPNPSSTPSPPFRVSFSLPPKSWSRPRWPKRRSAPAAPRRSSRPLPP